MGVNRARRKEGKQTREVGRRRLTHRRIEDIEVGDGVFAWDPETGETSIALVEALIRPEPKPIWRLETRDGDGQTETFEVIDDHPWYVEGAGWIETQSLRPGQRIETADDRGLMIHDITPTDRMERTYNLTVSGPHTFLVGEDGAVVHNCKQFTEEQRALAQLVREATRNGTRPLNRCLQRPGGRRRSAIPDAVIPSWSSNSRGHQQLLVCQLSAITS